MAIAATLEKPALRAVNGEGQNFSRAIQMFGTGFSATGVAVSGPEFSLPDAGANFATARGRDLGGSRRLKSGVLNRFCPVPRLSMKPDGSIARPRAKELPLSCAFLHCLPDLSSQVS